MNSPDYLNENSLRRFPFRDAANLLFGLAGLSLANNIFLDAQFDIRNRAALSEPPLFYLSNIDTTSRTIVIGGAQTFSFNYNFNGVQTLVHSASGNTAKLVINSDALTQFLTSNQISEIGSFAGQPQFCARCVRFEPRMVSSLALTNTEGSGLGNISYSNTFTSQLNLQQGTNIAYSSSDSTLSLTVQANAGAGLFDACPVVGSYIATINNDNADANGDYALNSDGCIRIKPKLSTAASVMLGNVCSPSTTSANIVDMAHYINRVNYRKDELNSLLSSAGNNYNAMIALQQQTELKKVEGKPPYVIAMCNSLKNSASTYNNITVGYYSSNADGVQTTPSISYAENSVPAQLQLIDNQTYFIQNDVRVATPLSTFDGSARWLPANSTSFLNFVLRQPGNALPNLGDSAYDITFGLENTSFASGYILPANPKTANFCVAYKTNKSAHTLELAIEPLVGDAEYNGGTSTDVTIDVGCTATANVLLTSSRMIIGEKCPTPSNSLRWSGTLDLSGNNRFLLNFSKADSGGTATILFSVRLTSGFGSATKQFTIEV